MFSDKNRVKVFTPACLLEDYVRDGRVRSPEGSVGWVYHICEDGTAAVEFPNHLFLTIPRWVLQPAKMTREEKQAILRNGSDACVQMERAGY